MNNSTFIKKSKGDKYLNLDISIYYIYTFKKIYRFDEFEEAVKLKLFKEKAMAIGYKFKPTKENIKGDFSFNYYNYYKY